jgi:hypothetical protein
MTVSRAESPAVCSLREFLLLMRVLRRTSPRKELGTIPSAPNESCGLALFG